VGRQFEKDWKGIAQRVSGGRKRGADQRILENSVVTAVQGSTGEKGIEMVGGGVRDKGKEGSGDQENRSRR
jgi:hypothetical protein